MMAGELGVRSTVCATCAGRLLPRGSLLKFKIKGKLYQLIFNLDRLFSVIYLSNGGADPEKLWYPNFTYLLQVRRNPKIHF